MIVGVLISLLIIAWVLFVVVSSYTQSSLPQDAGYDSTIDGQSNYRRCVLNSSNQIVYQWFSCTPVSCSESYYDVVGDILVTYDSVQLSSDERNSFLSQLSSCIDISAEEFHIIVK